MPITQQHDNFSCGVFALNAARAFVLPDVTLLPVDEAIIEWVRMFTQVGRRHMDNWQDAIEREMDTHWESPVKLLPVNVPLLDLSTNIVVPSLESSVSSSLGKRKQTDNPSDIHKYFIQNPGEARLKADLKCMRDESSANRAVWKAQEIAKENASIVHKQELAAERKRHSRFQTLQDEIKSGKRDILGNIKPKATKLQSQLGSETAVNIAETSRPFRVFKEDFRNESEGTVGRPRKSENAYKLTKYMNWMNPLLWIHIESAATKVGYGMS
ncbi:hypothetical protein BDQ17DRAFT_1336336 [Cyathus striatus]|nr:hypothetical protein BDQ17DRAFT_1336336 [Cyathus striatus]